MRSKFTFRLCRLIIALMICQSSYAQNSLLINFGSSACNSPVPAFSLIRDPLTVAPTALTTCDLSAQVPDYFNVFIAYNPKNNKIYVADIRSGVTKIWVLDMGLPANITCPVSIPATPDYTYSYVSNNFEFDNNGDLWSLSNYNSATGQCNIDKFDVTTGNVISTKILQFPDGQFPTTITSGDITILPNGRMFATLGVGFSTLYEITDYNSTVESASAQYLQTLPKDCFGIAYLSGLLEITGSDFGGTCYYYDYNIASNTLGTEKPFQNGQLPIDNSSLTPSVGCTKQLLLATHIDGNTADLVYEVYGANLGNMILNNVNMADDLGVPFGAANVSNVSVHFAPGSNAAGLTLNPGYNGTTDINILNPGQNLPNNTLTNHDYFFKVIISCRVTNLSDGIRYLNSAVANGNVGGGNPLTLLNVADSSNNGDTTRIDPNKNGNASDVGENVPTPYVFGLLPVTFLTIEASWLSKNTSLVKWQVATPTINAARFEVQYSTDRNNWKIAGIVQIEDSHRGNYDLTHLNVPLGNVYYRIRQIDDDGAFIYSKIVLLRSKANGNAYVIYPNPADNYIFICAASQDRIELFDATGRKLLVKTMIASTEEINSRNFPPGTYLLKISGEGDVKNFKVIVRH